MHVERQPRKSAQPARSSKTPSHRKQPKNGLVSLHLLTLHKPSTPCTAFKAGRNKRHCTWGKAFLPEGARYPGVSVTSCHGACEGRGAPAKGIQVLGDKGGLGREGDRQLAEASAALQQIGQQGKLCPAQAAHGKYAHLLQQVQLGQCRMQQPACQAPQQGA